MYHSHDFCDAKVVICKVFLQHRMGPAAERSLGRYDALWMKPRIGPRAKTSAEPADLRRVGFTTCVGTP